MDFGAVSPVYNGTMAAAQLSYELLLCRLIYVPDIAPTPRPAMKRPIVICTIENVVPVCIAVPTVNMADQMIIDPRRPNLSAVNA